MNESSITKDKRIALREERQAETQTHVQVGEKKRKENPRAAVSHSWEECQRHETLP